MIDRGKVIEAALGVTSKSRPSDVAITPTKARYYRQSPGVEPWQPALPKATSGFWCRVWDQVSRRLQR